MSSGRLMASVAVIDESRKREDLGRGSNGPPAKANIDREPRDRDHPSFDF